VYSLTDFIKESPQVNISWDCTLNTKKNIYLSRQRNGEITYQTLIRESTVCNYLGEKCLYKFLGAAWVLCGGVVVVWKIAGKLKKP